jgi:hypothetical protein
MSVLPTGPVAFLSELLHDNQIFNLITIRAAHEEVDTGMEGIKSHTGFYLFFPDSREPRSTWDTENAAPKPIRQPHCFCVLIL